MFEFLMLPLCEYHHFHCIEIDRRGFGNSDWTGSQTAEDIDYDMSAKTSLSSSNPSTSIALSS
jgi:pimeloyl-ACP methyl ester carboxylesterase